MPIYEYVCGKCGHHLEVMQKMSDKPLSRCPECRGKLEKVFSQTSFQLKGSGWYVSDYGNRNRGGSEKTETTAKSDSTDKPDKSDKSDKSSSEKGDKAPKAEKSSKKEAVTKAKSDAASSD